MNTTAAKTYTDRTCWKCGEETLVPSAGTSKSIAGPEAALTTFGSEHSVCSQCGAKSVNGAQAKRNQVVNRKARRASIRAANARAV